MMTVSFVLLRLLKLVSAEERNNIKLSSYGKININNYNRIHLYFTCALQNNLFFI